MLPRTPRSAALVPVGHPDEKGRYLLAGADAWQRQGDERGDTDTLTKAIAAYRTAIAEYTRDRAPLDWALAQNNLGNALRYLGERENGKARLEEAVAVYRAALEERTRDRAPLDWAKTETNLGFALYRLESGRTGRRGWKRRSRPTGRRSKSRRAIGRRSTGRKPITPLAPRSTHSGGGRTRQR